MYQVASLYEVYGKRLGLELLTGKKGLKRKIKVPEAHRPGLSLTGYLNGHAPERLMILGRVEIEYLFELSPSLRVERLKGILSIETPAVIIARGYNALDELFQICQENDIPLFRTTLTTMTLLSRLTLLLSDEFAPSTTCHGTFVEVFGVGVLIQGESAVGKSEAALGLIERGHRLISDDIVNVKCLENGSLEGYGAELSKHHMELRGIGIINVANLYGAVCVREKKRLDIVVRLEEWDDGHYYDRVGVEEITTELLDTKVPIHVLPVKPGRDVVLLLETIALNYRLKTMGYNSAKEFNIKLLREIEKKEKSRGAKNRKKGAYKK